ncbi:hypothetical protein LEP1GSC172_0574 [Leptospira noguchii]|uniref:Uncharacterized protein n=1 Tax=Leptospira noguchii TaxID=28182 RepID=M6VRJ9_9LEPT|nr:hypothetical protein LEP1GSC172_0574 [Leptospira noguchii]
MNLQFNMNLKYSLIVLRERKILFGKFYFFPRNQFSNKIENQPSSFSSD